MKLQLWDKIKKSVKLVIAYPKFYKLFCEIGEQNKDRAILIGTPIHGNLGDSLISQECISLLKKRYKKVIEIPEFFYEIFSEKIELDESDTIYICGGGWMGNLYEDELVIEDVLLRWPNHKKIVFPQTVSFNNKGKYSSIEQLKKILNNTKNTIVCVRDKNSYQLCINELEMDIEKCLYLPDMALLRLQVAYKGINKSQNVIFSIRDDVEKCSNDDDIRRIKDFLNKRNIKYKNSSTVISKKVVSISKRERYVQEKIDEYAAADLIITDRLHSMVFALAAGSKCIAIDNTTKKVSGVAKGWLKRMPGLWVIDNSALLTESFVEKCLYAQEYPTTIQVTTFYDELFERIKVL